MRWFLIVLILVFAFFIFFVIKYYSSQQLVQKNQELAKIKGMKITSSVFLNREKIPVKYTCNGENTNPPLEFSDVPADTKSLVLIVDDPDAPMGTWVHWVVYNINPAVRQVKENNIPDGGIEGLTSFGKKGYGGPCPPSGTHRYFFKLYALNKTLLIEGKTDKESVLQNMKDAVIDQAELIGLYTQQK